MKILIFGDVHGNLPALEQLFSKEKDSYDTFICHGDVVNYGPWSNDCVRFLSDRQNGTVLKGNHEEYFITGEYPGSNLVAQTFFRHCYPHFDQSLLDLIKNYGSSESAGNFTVKHTVGDRYIFADTDISDLELNGNYIIGHSHQQYKRQKDAFTIYNTGSLGQNRRYINQSCYLVFDTKTQSAELKNFEHDIDLVINQMKAENYPVICTDYYLSKERIS